ncbi:hypothetical protein MRB53_001965 [Persea americana]|uniref:Uncharacterized protein n=1 Tax=Persea americana TaxID=3435 RepID=A0ACC2MT34_PERAE|nr:hypothetical protein MRB53_001965 [Persea americana]
MEENMFKQKARDRHLNLGDSNSKYLYSLINSNRKRSTIKSIQDSTGSSYSKPSHIEEVFVDHFKSILAPTNQRPYQAIDLSHTRVRAILSSEDTEILCMPVSHL